MFEFPRDALKTPTRPADPEMAKFAKMGWNKLNIPAPAKPSFASELATKWTIDNPLKVS